MSTTKFLEIDCPICKKGTPYYVKYKANFELGSLDFAAKKTTKHMYLEM